MKDSASVCIKGERNYVKAAGNYTYFYVTI